MEGSFRLKVRVDLHLILASYRGIKACKSLGAVHASLEGYVFRIAQWKNALCHFPDIILMASDADDAHFQEVVSLLNIVLEKVWKLPVECPYADTKGTCWGRYSSWAIHCIGFCIAMG